MDHATIRANGAAFHVARTGSGPPLLLLHGWPEFWLTWRPVMARLADRYTLIAPDLRGFGDSDKPQGPYGPDQHTDDIPALLDALGIDRVGVVGHDVGVRYPAACGGVVHFFAVRAGPTSNVALMMRRKVSARSRSNIFKASSSRALASAPISILARFLVSDLGVFGQ